MGNATVFYAFSQKFWQFSSRIPVRMYLATASSSTSPAFYSAWVRYMGFKGSFPADKMQRQTVLSPSETNSSCLM